MRLTTVFKQIEKWYEYAKSVPEIRKPISYALYKTWRWCDVNEKERSNE